MIQQSTIRNSTLAPDPTLNVVPTSTRYSLLFSARETSSSYPG